MERKLMMPKSPRVGQTTVRNVGHDILSPPAKLLLVIDVEHPNVFKCACLEKPLLRGQINILNTELDTIPLAPLHIIVDAPGQGPDYIHAL